MDPTKKPADTIPLFTPWRVLELEEGSLARVVDANRRVLLEGDPDAVRVVVALANKTADLDDKAARNYWRPRAEEMERQANAAEDRATLLERDLKAARVQLLGFGVLDKPEEKPTVILRDDVAVAILAGGKSVQLSPTASAIVEAARSPGSRPAVDPLAAVADVDGVNGYHDGPGMKPAAPRAVTPLEAIATRRKVNAAAGVASCDRHTDCAAADEIAAGQGTRADHPRANYPREGNDPPA